MKDEDYIKQIADYYELPVEQVALIWSVVDWMNGEDIALLVDGFIEDKMCT